MFESFHWSGKTCSAKVALKSGPRRGTSMSAHLFSTTLGIPFGPGALKGLVLLIARLICLSVIRIYSNAGSLYSGSVSFSISVGWVVGKKLLNSISACHLL